LPINSKVGKGSSNWEIEHFRSTPRKCPTFLYYNLIV
jgi:hypothetical protein